MAMFNEDKNLKSGGCADEIAALIRDDLSPKMIQEQLENYHNSDIAKSMEQMDRVWRGEGGCLFICQVHSEPAPDMNT